MDEASTGAGHETGCGPGPIRVRRIKRRRRGTGTGPIRPSPAQNSEVNWIRRKSRRGSRKRKSEFNSKKCPEFEWKTTSFWAATVFKERFGKWWLAVYQPVRLRITTVRRYDQLPYKNSLFGIRDILVYIYHGSRQPTRSFSVWWLGFWEVVEEHSHGVRIQAVQFIRRSRLCKSCLKNGRLSMRVRCRHRFFFSNSFLVASFKHDYLFALVHRIKLSTF